MSLVYRFFKILVYGNFWISIAAVAISLNTFLLFGWVVSIELLLLIFFATILSYNFQRIVRHNSDSSISSSRHVWVNKCRKQLILLSIVSLLVCGVLFFLLFNFWDLLLISPVILIALFYAVNLPLSERALRDVPFIKIVLIAASWSVVSVILPAYLNNAINEPNVWILFALHFIFIVALVIPFDIRDVLIDEVSKKTIPQLLGVYSSKIVAVGLLVVCALGAYFFSPHYISLLPVYTIAVVVLFFVNSKRTEMFFNVVVDGLILLFPVSTWIIKFAL